MITFFTSPKPFNDHIRIIQRNAIASWRRLGDDVHIILFGDDAGIQETARDFAADHYPEVAKNNNGTPLLSDMLRKAESTARHEIICFINSDIILMSDFNVAVKFLMGQYQKFLMVGRCWNLDVTEPLSFDGGWEKELKMLAMQNGFLRDAYSIDYFVFPRRLYGEIPDFAIGRGWFDHWLVWKPRDLGACIVNATRSVHVIHQNHDYAHIAGGKKNAHRGEEAHKNFQLAGGTKNMRSIHNATHRLVNGELKRDIIGSYFPYWTRSYTDLLWVKFLNIVGPIRNSLRLQKDEEYETNEKR